jgi:hypothetical protein
MAPLSCAKATVPNVYLANSVTALKENNWRYARCHSSRPLQIHHRRYRSHGGTHTVDNLEPLCSDCHRLIHETAPSCARHDSRGDHWWAVQRLAGAPGPPHSIETISVAGFKQNIRTMTGTRLHNPTPPSSPSRISIGAMAAPPVLSKAMTLRCTDWSIDVQRTLATQLRKVNPR